MNITICITTILAAVLTLGDPSFLSRSRMDNSAPASCSTLKDSNTGTSGHDWYVIGNYTNNTYRATKFTAGSSYSVCKIELLLGKLGATGLPTGNIFANIYSDSGSAPSSMLATSSAVDSSTLAALGSSNYVSFTFASPVALTSGTVYWIGPSKLESQSFNSYVGWWGPDTFVANGNMVSSNSTAWDTGTSRRLNFKTYSE